MCGIAGVCWLTEPGGVSAESVNSMISMLQHRGPDESGLYLDDWVGLAHARLSIIDLCGGTQPIHNEDETLWIIYNGEVFNYRKLKQDLLKSGHRFYTSTDTEVILHLFEERGPDCLNELNGQFAFAIWNFRDKELFLARDRVGIRPLYFTVQKGLLIFASEIKAIFARPDVQRAIEPQALDQIFTFWATLPGYTPFKDIKELPPGHYLTTADGAWWIRRYWDIPFCSEQDYSIHEPGEITEHIGELLMDATRIRLHADVPVGCYLSGGLDSSGVTAMAKKRFTRELHTFGIRFEEDEYDEGKYQQEMVAFLKTDHTEVRATNKSIGHYLPEVIWHCEKPLLRTAPVPLYLLSEVVNQNGYKVVLTGEGADEVFGGYNIFREAKVRHFWAKEPNSALRPLLLTKLYPYVLNNPRLKYILRTFFGGGLERPDDVFFSHLIRWHNTSKIKTFFSADQRTATREYDAFIVLRECLPKEFSGWDYLARAQYLEMIIFLSSYLLSSQGDRVAMAHSVEIRLPYLDYRVIDFMGSVHPKWKIRGLQEKYLQKKVFQKILPQTIIQRSKHPYRAPIKQTLFNDNLAMLKGMCARLSIRDAAIFDNDRVARLINKAEKLERVSETDSMALVGILSTQLLYHQFIKNFPYRSVRASLPDLIVDRRTMAVDLLPTLQEPTHV